MEGGERGEGGEGGGPGGAEKERGGEVRRGGDEEKEEDGGRPMLQSHSLPEEPASLTPLLPMMHQPCRAPQWDGGSGCCCHVTAATH